MENIIRRSPVSFDARPAETEMRDNWTVVLNYDAENDGPHVIDLSHHMRWDLQAADLAGVQPFGIQVPEAPGQCVMGGGLLINRMNRTQASIWDLRGEKPETPAGTGFTETTDATLFLALCGKGILSLTEKLTALDFSDPHKDAPFLLQGPFSHVPCQIVVLEKSPERSGILMTCSRGYARSMIAAILEAGEEYGLQPAGEKVFTRWVSSLSGDGSSDD